MRHYIFTSLSPTLSVNHLELRRWKQLSVVGNNTSEIRETQSKLWWAKETITMSWKTLNMILSCRELYGWVLNQKWGTGWTIFLLKLYKFKSSSVWLSFSSYMWLVLNKSLFHNWQLVKLGVIARRWLICYDWMNCNHLVKQAGQNKSYKWLPNSIHLMTH